MLVQTLIRVLQTEIFISSLEGRQGPQNLFLALQGFDTIPVKTWQRDDF